MNYKKLDKILKALDKYVLFFIAFRVGKDILSSSEKENLKKTGIDYDKIPSSMSTVENVFKFGIISSYIEENAIKKISLDKLNKVINSKKILTLTNVEKDAITGLKTKMYYDIKKENEKIKRYFTDSFMDIKTVENLTEKTIKERKGVNYLSKMFENHYKNFEKDFDAIAQYNLHGAFEHGRVIGIKKQYGGKHLIFKDVYPFACKDCQRLFLTNGIGSDPILFSLDELLANGSNIGLKREDWKPTINAVHPYCNCTTNRVPYNFSKEEYEKGEWEFDYSIRNFKKIEK